MPSDHLHAFIVHLQFKKMTMLNEALKEKIKELEKKNEELQKMNQKAFDS